MCVDVVRLGVGALERVKIFILAEGLKIGRESSLEDFFKVPPTHMKVPPDHYKGQQVTSKGHTPLVDSGRRHGKV